MKSDTPNSLVATSNTLVQPPPAETQTVAALAPPAREASGRKAFSEISGESGGYDSLPQAGKDAFVAVGLLDKGDERYATAKQAALDAVRDAKQAGLFTTNAANAAQNIAQSKDPAVRNQLPTGTQGESAGPANQGAAPAPNANGPSTTTPAVTGQKP